MTSPHGTAKSLHKHLDKSNIKLPRRTTILLASSVQMPRGYEPSQPVVLNELHSIIDEEQHWLNDSECTSWAVFHSKRSIAKVHADFTV